jgi:hypothetical protein
MALHRKIIEYVAVLVVVAGMLVGITAWAEDPTGTKAGDDKPATPTQPNGADQSGDGKSSNDQPAENDATGPRVVWGKLFGTKERDSFLDVAVGADGNIVAVGWSYEAQGGEPDSRKYSQIFAVKCDADGKELWRKTFRGDFNNVGAAVAVGGDGSIYVAATVNKRRQLRANARHGNDVESVASDICVLKLDPHGKEVWRATEDAGQLDWAIDVVVDSTGNCSVVGMTREMAKEGEPITKKGFVVSYDSRGRQRWRHNLSERVVGRPKVLKADKEGAVYVFGEETDDTESKIPQHDIFLVKFRSDGQLAWRKEIAGEWNDFLHGATVTAEGEMILMAWTRRRLGGALRYGGGSYLARYSAAGERLWVRPIENRLNDDLYQCELTADGMAYVLGETSSRRHGGGGFVAAYDRNGKLLWQVLVGTPWIDYLTSLAITRNGCVVVGDAAGDHFGPPLGRNDAFVAKVAGPRTGQASPEPSDTKATD